MRRSIIGKRRGLPDFWSITSTSGAAAVPTIVDPSGLQSIMVIGAHLDRIEGYGIFNQPFVSLPPDYESCEKDDNGESYDTSNCKNNAR